MPISGGGIGSGPISDAGAPGPAGSIKKGVFSLGGLGSKCCCTGGGITPLGCGTLLIPRTDLAITFVGSGGTASWVLTFDNISQWNWFYGSSRQATFDCIFCNATGRFEPGLILWGAYLPGCGVNASSCGHCITLVSYTSSPFQVVFTDVSFTSITITP